MQNKLKKMPIAIIGFLFILIIVWIIEIKNNFLPYVDQWTRSIVNRTHDTVVYDIFRWITELGSSHVLIPIAIIAAVLLAVLYRHWYPALLLLGGSLFAHGINIMIKTLVGRERPSISAALNAEGYSFPSGHAMIPIVCYGLIAYLLGKRMGSGKNRWLVQAMFGCLVLLIGISRFFINVHYLTDIITGFTIGFLFLFLLIAIDKKRDRSPS